MRDILLAVVFNRSKVLWGKKPDERGDAPCGRVPAYWPHTRKSDLQNRAATESRTQPLTRPI
jgi:hypothetical protein